MTSFKKKVQKRIQLIAWNGVLSVTIITIAFFIRLNMTGYALEKLDNKLFILLGAFFGVVYTSVIRITRYRKALKNKDTLEELYIKETDERNCAIILKTSRTCITATIILLAVAAIIASMFNTTVFFTLGYVLIVVLLLYLGLSIYFSKTG